MTTTLNAYESAAERLQDVLSAVPADVWAGPSPCPGWTARDVVAHMIGTQRDFLTGHGADLGPAPDVVADPASAWRAHVGRVLTAVSDDDLVSTSFDGHFGPTTVGSTLEQFYVWDMVVHRWDVARSAGLPAAFSPAELDRIERGADGFGPALYMEGVCRPGVTAREDDDRTTRVLARLGRTA